MNKLAVDTSTNILSVALMKQQNVVSEMMLRVKRDHSSRLMPTVVQLMDEVDLTPEEIDHIYVGIGPGSYTGTRIGVTMAKTFAWSLQIPIYTDSSLRNLAKNIYTEQGLICSFFDARRNNVFAGIYRWNENSLETVEEDRHIALDTLLFELKQTKQPIVFLSPDWQRVKEQITNTLGEQATFAKPPYHNPRAAHLFTVEREKEPSPVHLVAPNYVRLTQAEANLLQKKKDE